MSEEQVETFEATSPDVLYNNAEPEKVEVVETEVKAEEPEAEAAQETDIKTEETDEEVVSTSTEPAEESLEDRLARTEKALSGMQGAYKAEKEKRQEAEKVERPDVFEDQEGFANSIRAEGKQEIDDLRYGLLQNDLVSRHADGVEVIKAFDELRTTKTSLMAELEDQVSKANSEGRVVNALQLAYDIYQNHISPNQTIDVDAIDKAGYERGLAEANKAAKTDGLNAIKDNLPTNLTNEPSRAPRGSKEYVSPTAESLYD